MSIDPRIVRIAKIIKEDVDEPLDEPLDEIPDEVDERYFVFDIIDGQLTLVFGPANDRSEVDTFLLGQYGTSDLAPAPHAGHTLYLAGKTEVMVVPESSISDFFARME